MSHDRVIREHVQQLAKEAEIPVSLLDGPTSSETFQALTIDVERGNEFPTGLDTEPMSEDTANETRFNARGTYYGDPAKRAVWETEQRAWLEHKGISDFEVTHGDGTVTIAYTFTGSPKDAGGTVD